MLEITPNYYKQFKCIADRCNHNCCIGWEIDVDKETAKKYSSLKTPLGERIRCNLDGDPPHFVLKEGDRCPFLNENNLCDIISELGDEGLCEICSLHPRFGNHYSDFYETGLGLSCEEAARIVLTFNDKFKIDFPDSVSLTSDEEEFFEVRHAIFDVLQNRDENVLSRFERLAKMFCLKFDFELCDIVPFFLSLERLDDAWSTELEKLNGFDFDKSFFANKNFEIALEQLSVYLVFRHLPEAIEFGDYGTVVNFVLMCCYLLGALCSFNKWICCDEKFLDLVRMFSAEIEYSRENTESLLDFCYSV